MFLYAEFTKDFSAVCVTVYAKTVARDLRNVILFPSISLSKSEHL